MGKEKNYPQDILLQGEFTLENITISVKSIPKRRNSEALTMEQIISASTACSLLSKLSSYDNLDEHPMELSISRTSPNSSKYPLSGRKINQTSTSLLVFISE